MQVEGDALPFSQLLTAFAAHGDRSSTEWPEPGTTSTCACGKRPASASAPAVGVRMSRSPEMISTGTSGSGPGPSAAPPEGAGQKMHSKGAVSESAHAPNAPSALCGTESIAACAAACFCASDAFGSQGNGPSPQLVARLSATLTSLKVALFTICSSASRRSSGNGQPRAAASIAAGSSEEMPLLRSLVYARPTISSPSMRTATVPFVDAVTFAISGLDTYWLARLANRSPIPLGSVGQAPAAQIRSIDAGISRRESVCTGLRSGGSAESSSRRSTWVGWASA